VASGGALAAARHSQSARVYTESPPKNLSFFFELSLPSKKKQVEPAQLEIEKKLIFELLLFIL